MICQAGDENACPSTSRDFSPRQATRRQHGLGEQETELQEVTRQLSNYVLEGSKEWKHERRKANNRLYQRLKRNGQHIVYEKHKIRVDMRVKHKDKAEAKKAWLLLTCCGARLPVWPAAGASSQAKLWTRRSRVARGVAREDDTP